MRTVLTLLAAVTASLIAPAALEPSLASVMAQNSAIGHVRVMNCFASIDRAQEDEAYYQWYCEDFADNHAFDVEVPGTGSTKQIATDQYGSFVVDPLPRSEFTLRDNSPPEQFLEPFVTCDAPVEIRGQAVTITPPEGQERVVCSWYRVPRRSEEYGGQPCVDDDPPEGQIYLYADRQFAGQCEAFLTGDPDLGDNESGLGVADNDASSVKVGRGVRAILCDDPEASGACSILVTDSSFACDDGPAPPLGSYPDLGCANIGDGRVSSLAVVRYDDCAETRPHPNEVILYSEPGYGGRCRFLGMGVHLDDLRGLALGSAGAASARIGPGAGAILCAAPAFDRCEVFELGDADFTFDAVPGQTRVLSAVTFPRSKDQTQEND